MVQFLQKLKDSGHWNDDYDYSKVEYIDSKTKVIVIDKKFNTEHYIANKRNSKNATHKYTALMIKSFKEYS